MKTDDQEFIPPFCPRLVGLGIHQQTGIDYVESFSPVARIVTFRVLVALATKVGLVLYQGDQKTEYLNADLKIKQYVRNIPGSLNPQEPYTAWTERSMDSISRKPNGMQRLIPGWPHKN